MPDAGQAPPWDDRPFNPAIVRADCMVIARDRFEAVGGFEATRLPRSLYDVDLALRLRERNLRNVYAPEVTFTCGFAREAPPADEIAYLWERWWEELGEALSDQHEPARLARRDFAGLLIPTTVGA
jgi:GT2 family glycosyltransferase